MIERMREVQTMFVTNETQQAAWGELKEEIYGQLQRRFEKVAKYVESNLEGVAKISDIEEMIKPKASKEQQTELRQAINGIKSDLAPLMEKGHTLRNFISSVNKEAEKEENN